YTCFTCRSVFFLWYGAARRYLASFPTRRSSDLFLSNSGPINDRFGRALQRCERPEIRRRASHHRSRCQQARGRPILPSADFRSRSEEHTSELQSRENLVCRLLLEKKKYN